MFALALYCIVFSPADCIHCVEEAEPVWSLSDVEIAVDEDGSGVLKVVVAVRGEEPGEKKRASIS